MNAFWTFVCAALILVFSGCAATPDARWSQGRAALTVTQDVLVQQNRAGTLSDADLVATEPFVEAARGALDRAYQLLPDGGPDFDFYLDIATDVLTKIEARKSAKAPKGTDNDARSDSRGHRIGPDDHLVRRLGSGEAQGRWDDYRRAA